MEVRFVDARNDLATGFDKIEGCDKSMGGTAGDDTTQHACCEVLGLVKALLACSSQACVMELVAAEGTRGVKAGQSTKSFETQDVGCVSREFSVHSKVSTY